MVFLLSCRNSKMMQNNSMLGGLVTVILVVASGAVVLADQNNVVSAGGYTWDQDPIADDILPGLREACFDSWDYGHLPICSDGDFWDRDPHPTFVLSNAVADKDLSVDDFVEVSIPTMLNCDFSTTSSDAVGDELPWFVCPAAAQQDTTAVMHFTICGADQEGKLKSVGVLHS